MNRQRKSTEKSRETRKIAERNGNTRKSYTLFNYAHKKSGWNHQPLGNISLVCRCYAFMRRPPARSSKNNRYPSWRFHDRQCGRWAHWKGMNLLQTLDGSWFHCFEYPAFYERVGFLLALSVNAVVAICEPIKEIHSALIIGIFRELSDTVCVQHIRIVSLTISSTQLQLVSGANQLISFLTQFCL